MDQQTTLWNQVNSQLDYAFLICAIITVAVVVLQLGMAEEYRPIFYRYAIGLTGGVLVISVVLQWLQ